MKITIECPEGFTRTIDDVGDVHYGPLRFNSKEEFDRYIESQFKPYSGDDSRAVILEGSDGRSTDFAPEVTRIDMWFRDFSQRTYLINKRAFLVDDETGETFDVIKPPKHRARNRARSAQSVH